jgi:putative lipoic acid-binding regulatory protein
LGFVWNFQLGIWDFAVMATREEALELLRQTHDFPARVMVKVIGVNQNALALRVAAAIRDSLGLPDDPDLQIRETPAGRHIAVTVEPEFQTAEEVLDAYEVIRQLDGVVMLM